MKPLPVRTFSSCSWFIACHPVSSMASASHLGQRSGTCHNPAAHRRPTAPSSSRRRGAGPALGGDDGGGDDLGAARGAATGPEEPPPHPADDDHLLSRLPAGRPPWTAAEPGDRHGIGRGLAVADGDLEGQSTSPEGSSRVRGGLESLPRRKATFTVALQVVAGCVEAAAAASPEGWDRP